MAAGAEERVHTAGSGPGRLRRLAREMHRGLRQSPPLAALELGRRLRARYRGSRLGWVWALAPALVVTLWATLAARARVLGAGDVAAPYPLYALWGLVLWQGLVESLTFQVEGLAAERPLLARVALPPEAIILSRAGEAAFGTGVKLAVASAAFLPFGFVPPATLVFAPLAALPLLALGTALGLALAPFAALQAGVGRILPAALVLWFVVTPVLFRLPAHGALRLVMRANPASALLDGARGLALGGAVDAPWTYAIVALLALAALLPAWGLYRLALPFLLERSGL